MKNLKIILLIFAATLTIYSCQEKEVNSIEPTSNENILKFESMEEVQNTLEQTKGMELEDLKKWQISRGFKSFGVTALDLYNKIDIEKLNSQDELRDYVFKFQKYLQLIEEENGEITFETKLFFPRERFIINDDQLFQVRETVTKVFETGQLSTDISNINELKSIDEQQFLSKQFGDKFYVSKSNTDITSRLSCPIIHDLFSTNKRNRTTFRVEAYAYSKSTFAGYENYVGVSWQVRPYIRTLGIWYHTTRTLSARIKIKVQYTTSYENSAPTTRTRIVTHSEPGVTAKVYDDGVTLEDYITNNTPPNQPPNPNLRVLAIDSWGDTPETSPVVFKCNADSF